MFDPKSLLEALMRGAQPPAPPQPAPSGQGGFGGLADILAQLGGQAGQGQPQAAPRGQPQGGGTGGGLADILAQLQEQLGRAGQAQGQPGGQRPAQRPQEDEEEDDEEEKPARPTAARPAAQPGAGDGGLGDLLRQLQESLGRGGQAPAPHAAPSQQGGGGLMDILGQVLGQATSGVREGAAKIDEATGVGRQARDAIGQATGRSPDELLAQLQELIRNNQLGAGAALGGLGAVVLGTKTGRSLATSAAKLGALVLISGLAYKAYQNYTQGRTPATGGPAAMLTGPAPEGSGFEPDAVTEDTATTLIRAMIAAASADGRIDEAEQQKILSGLKQAGIDSEADEEAREFLQQELEQPATAEDLAASVSGPEEAVQVYTAARLAIDVDTDEEHAFLSGLAQALNIDAKLAQHVDAQARSAGAV